MKPHINWKLDVQQSSCLQFLAFNTSCHYRRAPQAKRPRWEKINDSGSCFLRDSAMRDITWKTKLMCFGSQSQINIATPPRSLLVHFSPFSFSSLTCCLSTVSANWSCHCGYNLHLSRGFKSHSCSCPRYPYSHRWHIFPLSTLNQSWPRVFCSYALPLPLVWPHKGHRIKHTPLHTSPKVSRIPKSKTYELQLICLHSKVSRSG